MSIGKNSDGLTIRRYATVSFQNPGSYPDGYSWEMHRDMGAETCEICHRLFSEHTPEEFTTHLDEIAVRARERNPVILTPEQIEQIKDLIRKDPRLTPEQAEEAIKERFPDSKEPK